MAWTDSPHALALVNSLKGVSARYLRQEYSAHVRKYLWGGHFWSRSSYAGSTGDASLATVRTSIQSPGPAPEMRRDQTRSGWVHTCGSGHAQALDPSQAFTFRQDHSFRTNRTRILSSCR
ncbi:transposase [Nonomuraea polychroma]|nr:transposase [Nonomuraea polychroma]